jgi:hypothetical protein
VLFKKRDFFLSFVYLHYSHSYSTSSSQFQCSSTMPTLILQVCIRCPLISPHTGCTHSSTVCLLPPHPHVYFHACFIML